MSEGSEQGGAVIANHGGSPWPKDRLVIALQLMAFLPTSAAAAVTRKEILRHLEIASPRFYSLVKVMRDAGIKIESQFSPKGMKVYWLGKRDQGLIDKLLK